MTTLNTIIEEEKKGFVYKLNRLTPAGGFMLENGDYGHGMLSETFMTDFLTTAIQRAYEAGREEERDRILNILSNLVPKDEDAMDVINDWIIPELKRAIHSELDQPNK